MGIDGHDGRRGRSMATRVALGLALLVGCASPGADAPDEALAAAEPALPAQVESALLEDELPDRLADRLFTIEHRVPVGPDRWIHLRETFRLRAWFRRDRRAVLMLPGPLVTGEFFEIPVDGYRGRSIVAREGAFAFTADFEGTGDSSRPADGRDATHASQVEAMRRVVRYIRWIRRVRRVDVLGESWGGGVAAEVCADRRRVRSCVLGSMLYRTPSDFANETFRSPGFRALVESMPDGYFPTTPETLAGLTAAMEPEVAAWTAEAMPGRYAVVPLLDVFDLPFFDVPSGRVPALLVQGEHDPNQSLDDARDLVADWGPSMRLVVIEGGGHIPRTEPAPIHDHYWAAVLGFWAL